MTGSHEPPGYRQILVFWLPLLGTWLMMSVEGPMLSALISRMADPKFNLAAYGVAFALALLAEAPIMMLTSAATRLAADYPAYLKLARFARALNLMVTGVILLTVYPPFFNWFARSLMGLSEPVAELTYKACLLLLPWPGAIGYRRFYQGILIRYNRTRLVAYGTVVRLLTMSATALTLFYLDAVPGVIMGTAALSLGVLGEATATRLMAIPVIRALRNNPEPPGEALTYPELSRFYLPLALSPFIALGTNPIITFFLGKSQFSLESLAVFPVINSLVFFFRSPALSYQEVVIAHMGDGGETFRRLRNFALTMGAAVTLLMSLVAFTVLFDFYFRDFTELSETLSHLALLPTRVMVILPALSVLLAFQRAVLISARISRPITLATVLELFGICAVLYLGIIEMNLVGITAVALALVLGRLAANFYLTPPLLTALKTIRKPAA